MGVVSAGRCDLVREKKAGIDELTALLSSIRLAPSKSVNERLAGIGLEKIKNPVTLAELLRRPGIRLRDLAVLEPKNRRVQRGCGLSSRAGREVSGVYGPAKRAGRKDKEARRQTEPRQHRLPRGVGPFEGGRGKTLQDTPLFTRPGIAHPRRHSCFGHRAPRALEEDGRLVKHCRNRACRTVDKDRGGGMSAKRLSADRFVEGASRERGHIRG